MASCQEDMEDQQERVIAMMRRECDRADRRRNGKRLPLLLIACVVFLLFLGLAIGSRLFTH